MNPFTLVPAADTIPVHWGWFKFLLITGFMAHILLMNIMVGTGIIALFTQARPGRKGEDLPFQKDISSKLPVITAFVINFGVVPLLFLQVVYGQFIYVSSQLMAIWWLSVIGVLIAAYYAIYYYKFRFDRLGSLGKPVLGLAVCLLLFIGFMFSGNMTLMINPAEWSRYFARPDGTLFNFSDPALIPRYLHFMTASVAVSGLFIAAVWTLKKKKGVADADMNITRGMKWFIRSTLFQIFTGFWFQLALPENIMNLFLGGDGFHTAVFVIGLCLMVQALWFAVKHQVWPAVASLLLLVSDMIVMRDLVRSAYLDPYFRFSGLEITGQYLSFIIFLVSLVIVAGLVVYVLRLAAGSRDTAVSATVRK